MDDYDYMENYFSGALSPEEMKQFDEKIQNDPAFAEDVAFYCISVQEIKNQVAEEKKKRFKEIYKEQNNKKTVKEQPVRKLWPYISAAAIIIALVLGFYLFLSKTTPTQMADTYVHEKFEQMSVTMGIENGLQKGTRLYNEKKFTEALNQFNDILKTDTANTEAKKCAGIVSLQLKDYDKALAYFIQYENTPLYVNPGKFYHALTLLKRNQPGDLDEAKNLLQQIVSNDLAEKKTAEEWLKKL
jgi:tetratricopeptide (TPR) repeat protein